MSLTLKQQELRVGDTITITGDYHRRTFWQWLTRKEKRLVRYTATSESLKPGALIYGD